MTTDCEAPCLKHNRNCPIAWKNPGVTNPSERALTINCSGPVCLPWCAPGKREGEAHESMPPCWAWLRE
eukprot:316531-Alexandrium_andersonii.AAC.1